MSRQYKNMHGTLYFKTVSYKDNEINMGMRSLICILIYFVLKLK